MKRDNKIESIKIHIFSTPFLSIILSYLIVFLMFENIGFTSNLLMYLFVSQIIYDSLRGKLKFRFVIIFIYLFIIMVPFLFKYHMLFFLIFPFFFMTCSKISKDVENYKNNKDKDGLFGTIGFSALFGLSLSIILLYCIYYFVRFGSIYFVFPDFVVIPHVLGMLGYALGNIVLKIRRRFIHSVVSEN